MLTRLLCCLSLVAAVSAADWTVGWQAATAQAEQTHRPILMNFTGSDWCPWCQRLDQEVFKTPAFAAWASTHVVLLTVDFPRATSLPATQARENDQLAARFHVDGFPTIVLVDATGVERGRLGYQPGGATAWIAAADRILSAPPKS
jgi:thioredoxin-related protein